MLKYGHLYYLLLLACEEQLKVRSWTATAAKSDKRANKKGEVITATTARWDISYPIRKFASKAIKWSHVILISCESGKKEEKSFYTKMFYALTLHFTTEIKLLPRWGVVLKVKILFHNCGSPSTLRTYFSFSDWMNI